MDEQQFLIEHQLSSLTIHTMEIVYWGKIIFFSSKSTHHEIKVPCAPRRAMPLKSLLLVLLFSSSSSFHMCVSFIFFGLVWTRPLVLFNTRVSHKCETIACLWLGVSNRAFEIFVEFSNIYFVSVVDDDVISVHLLPFRLHFNLFLLFCLLFRSFFRAALYGLIFCVIGSANFIFQRTPKKSQTEIVYIQSKPLKVLLLFGFKQGNSCNLRKHADNWKRPLCRQAVLSVKTNRQTDRYKVSIYNYQYFRLFKWRTKVFLIQLLEFRFFSLLSHLFILILRMYLVHLIDYIWNCFIKNNLDGIRCKLECWKLLLQNQAFYVLMFVNNGYFVYKWCTIKSKAPPPQTWASKTSWRVN